jgi:predicted transcriptional regulator
MRNRAEKPEQIVPFLLRLPETLHKRIKRVAVEQDRSAQAEIRRAITAHVEAHEAKDAA